MKLTPKEQQICEEFSRKDRYGRFRCYECPLNLHSPNALDHLCYVTIDGRLRAAKELKRWL